MTSVPKCGPALTIPRSIVKTVTALDVDVDVEAVEDEPKPKAKPVKQTQC